MKVVQEQPKIMDEARNVFRLPEGVVMTWGDILYNPSGRHIDLPLMRHEEHHSKQQGNDPSGWWKRYFSDKDFRISQEIEAYRIQYQEAKKINGDRNTLMKYAMLLASDLSSEMYGSMMTRQEALKAIALST